MKQSLLIIGIFITGIVFGQESYTIDFLSEIKQYDISNLWTLDKFQDETDTNFIERKEPLGYIGENYQRFYIHFISAIQNPNNRLEYLIYGKTKVKETICSFQGIIKITTSQLYIESEFPKFRQGFVKGEYNFFEDPDQKETGILKGNFQTNFYLDQNGKIKYDALTFVADGFENNQFNGTWTNYQNNNSKKCNWGDYRIPDSKDFDVGTSEFIPSKNYYSNGWFTYALDHKMNKLDIVEDPSISKIENEKWWIDK